MSDGNILGLFATTTVWAAGGAEHHAPSIHDVWFPLANFLIYVFILVKFVLPVVRDYLASRRQDVVSTIAQAASKKAAAESVVNNYKTKIAGLDGEIQSIERGLREEGEREQARLVSEAQGLATKIKEDARFLADQEVKIARQNLRQEMATEAEAAARELLRQHLSAADLNRLAEEFIENMSQAR